MIAARNDGNALPAQQHAMREVLAGEPIRRRMEGAIDLPVFDALQRLTHLRLDDRDIDIRTFRLKARDGARQDHGTKDRASADHDTTAPAFNEIIDLALRAAELAENDARPPLQRAAERR